MKIIQNYDGCIGCGTCVALCPEFWEMDDNGKARPKGGAKNTAGEYELEIKNIECNQEAVDSCPVQVIRIV